MMNHMMPMIPTAFWLVIALAIIAILWLVLRARPESSESPAQIAQRRYARGELDRLQFEELITTLSQPAPTRSDR